MYTLIRVGTQVCQLKYRIFFFLLLLAISSETVFIVQNAYFIKVPILIHNDANRGDLMVIVYIIIYMI